MVAIKKTAKSILSAKTLSELKTDLLAKRNDIIEAKRGHKLGELTNPHVITLTRKQIARLQTAITAVNMAPKGDK